VQFAKGNGVPKDEGRAVKLFALPCQRGDQVACGWLKDLKPRP
jgi:hypothetical protein